MNAIALQSDGKIVALGSSSINIGPLNFSLARYNSNGTLDDTFGSGKFIAKFKDKITSEGKSLLIQPDGKILAVGFTADLTNSQFAIARYVDQPTDFQETSPPSSGGGGCSMVPFSSLNPIVLILGLVPVGYFGWRRYLKRG